MNAEAMEKNLMNRRKTMSRMTSIGVFPLILCSWSTAVSGPALSEEAITSKGHAFALLVCAACHVVAPDQESAPILRNPGPSFDTIANRPTTTEESLRTFLSTTHAQMGISSGMPNPRLANYQITEVISYILGLRNRH